jgi:colicin import membrane protein
MAERQETSVMASIQDILRDAQSREEEERVEAEKRARAEEQRRIDDVRRKQEEEAARLRAEEEERDRKAYEEKRRSAELAAMQGAAVERAKAETEAKARLAEMTARQEHERHLHALTQDKGKKNLRMVLIGLAVLFVGAAIGGGVYLKNVSDQKEALAARVREAQDKLDEAEAQTQKVRAELANTKDPEKIAALQAELAKAQQAADDAKAKAVEVKKPTYAGGGGGGGGGGGAAPAPKPASKPGAACNCTPGDPLCSCL